MCCILSTLQFYLLEVFKSDLLLPTHFFSRNCDLLGSFQCTLASVYHLSSVFLVAKRLNCFKHSDRNVDEVSRRAS